MMGNYFGSYGYGGMGIFGSIIALLVIIFLVLGIAYFWQELQKKK